MCFQLARRKEGVCSYGGRVRKKQRIGYEEISGRDQYDINETRLQKEKKEEIIEKKCSP